MIRCFMSIEINTDEIMKYYQFYNHTIYMFSIIQQSIEIY